MDSINLCVYVHSLERKSGGVATVTNMLARALHEREVNIFAISEFDVSGCEECSNYMKILYEQSVDGGAIDRIVSFLKENNVQIFLNQFGWHKYIIPVIEGIKSHTDVKVVSALHANPKFFEGVRLPDRRIPVPQFLERTLFSAWKVCKRQDVKRTIRSMYELSDAYVVLSEKYIQEFSDYYKLSDTSKLTYINNPACTTLPMFNGKKENIMLFVGRLHNEEKRIDRILRIWYYLYKKCSWSQDWQLIIVGDGVDRKMLERMSEKLRLKNISFVGYCAHPEAYYERAKFILMTSNAEGWGMSIIEAMRFGCVPIAYETYSAITDIVDDEGNGCLAVPDNIKGFIQCLEKAISNYKAMSDNAQQSILKFDVGKIANEWMNLFSALMSGPYKKS